MGIKDSYTTEVYNGLTIQVARMGLDPDYEYKGTVVGKPFGPNAVQRSQSIDDPELEAAGWQSCGHTNGGIFYKEPSDGNWMASGIEVLMGNATQLWDTRFDSCAAIGFYHSGGMVIATQADIKALAAAGQLRGAVTAAFGIKLNGQRWTAGSEFNAQRDYIYSNKSGRTIVGQAANGQYVMVSVPGTSGKSGLTGSQLPALADHLGLTAAVCLDGGGSRYLSYCGSIKTNTTRAVKNDIIIYRRKKATPTPDPKPDTKPDHQPDAAGDGMVLITDKGPLRIRNAVMGDKILCTVPQGEQIDILDMLAGRQQDGYQWAFVSYTPVGKSDKIIGYSQIDLDYSQMDEKEN
ncbi:phosphodiester glycosidase family protein [Holdemania massiliensis]|uniref:phosphodiester glycosidase family protein n=1 Tax=Holdemania massiliensis TaxID=1468449 RepID=UPI003521362C